MEINRNTKPVKGVFKSKVKEEVIALISGRSLPDPELMQIISDLVYKYGRLSGYDLDECLVIGREIFDAMFGYDVLQQYLDDELVNEIMVNSCDQIIIEKNGQMIVTESVFDSVEIMMNVIQNMVSKINRRVDMSTPIVDGRLKDGSRLHIVLPPVALNGPIITIRKFHDKKFELHHLVEMKLITEEVKTFLIQLIKCKYNIFVSGGTSSGKTTFLNALSSYIPNDERIITIEDSAELNLKHITNLVSLETKPANLEGEGLVDMEQLIKASLRMRPDRIIVGEVRGKEALDMIHAMNTGHDGSLSTGHANSAFDMLKRLELMILKGIDLNPTTLIQLLSSSVDIIIHLERGSNGKRYIEEIVEILPATKEYILNPIYHHSKLHDLNNLKQTRKREKYEENYCL